MKYIAFAILGLILVSCSPDGFKGTVTSGDANFKKYLVDGHTVYVLDGEVTTTMHTVSNGKSSYQVPITVDATSMDSHSEIDIRDIKSMSADELVREYNRLKKLDDEVMKKVIEVKDALGME